jgi:hypothetical protein
MPDDIEAQARVARYFIEAATYSGLSARGKGHLDLRREKRALTPLVALDAIARLTDATQPPAPDDVALIARSHPACVPSMLAYLRSRLRAPGAAGITAAQYDELLDAGLSVVHRGGVAADDGALDADDRDEIEVEKLDERAPDLCARDWPDGATTKQLAEAYGCTPANVRRVIKQLQTAGKIGKKIGLVWAPDDANRIWKNLSRKNASEK